MGDSVLLWTGFNIFILCMLALDLGVFHKKDHEVSVKEALVWTGIWITLAMAWQFRTGLRRKSTFWRRTKVRA